VQTTYVPSAVATTQRVIAPLPATGPTVAPQPQVAMDERARGQIIEATQANVARRFGVDKTPQLNDYLILVGSMVSINTPKPELEYSYVLLDTDQPLHFGLGPKTIYISRGLLQQMQDESELAGVIGREIANLLAGRAMQAAGIPAAVDATAGPTTVNAANAVTASATTVSAGVINRYAAKLTDVVLKDGLGADQEQAADVEGAKFAAAARYAPDGFLRLLTRQKSAGAGAQAVPWERIKALDANVQIIAKAYPAADVRLPARFAESVKAVKPN
jgi:predicted Zn-dependent protease